MSRSPKLWVTVHADASFDPRTRRGGWAVWVKTEAGRIVRSGPCPAYVTNAHHAELAAIFAGIHLAVTHFPETTAVLVRSDCQPALRDVDNLGRPARHRVLSHLREKILKTLAGRVVRTSWVKGHDGAGTRPSWVNTACDRMAKEARLHHRPKDP